MLRPFKLHEPTSVHDAVSLLGQYGEEAKVYCGGTELLLAMKEGLLRYNHLVNIKTIPGLDEIAYDHDSGMLSIGATVTHGALECSSEIQSHFPMIAQAEGNVANVRVRNVGTIGGNLCFSTPLRPGSLSPALRYPSGNPGIPRPEDHSPGRSDVGSLRDLPGRRRDSNQDTGASVPARLSLIHI